jgi:hypothetical protein
LGLNISGGHAARIQAQDLLLKALQSRLMLLDQLGFEASLAVSRQSNLDLALGAFELLAAAAIPRVRGPFPSPSVLGIAQMDVQFGFSTALDDRFGQLFDQSALC